MELKLVKEVKDIVALLDLEDNIEDYFPCDKGEWNQWLMQIIMVENTRIKVWLALEKEVIQGYIVVVDNRNLPISDDFFIMYVYSGLNFYKNKKLLDQLIEEIKKEGGKKIIANTKNPELLKKYGFKNIGVQPMILEI